MRVWFITGASRGLGLLIAGEALKAGDAVVATARTPQAIVDQLGDQPNLLALPLDVTDEAGARKATDAAVERFGRIDILVNNAGFGLLGAVEEAQAAEIQRLYATNVFGLLSVSRAVLPHMRRQRAGRVFNITSVGGHAAAAGWGVYSSTKFAVEGLSEAMAAELAPLGIFVTAVAPGYFRTDFLDDRSLSVMPNQIADYDGTAGAMRRFAAGVNHAQPGDPARLARAMITLADAPNPPRHMPFGTDSIARITEKHAAVAREIEAWHALAVSTDFPAVSS